jgi:Xaa-Pro aminopeptidase
MQLKSELEFKIERVQELLGKARVDGWLLYEWQGQNPLCLDFLQAKAATRRFFYFIPTQGIPIKIVHQIEQDVLDHLPGKKCVYLSYTELEDLLKATLDKTKVVVMEVSEKNRLPYVSKVDSGTVDLVRSFNVKVQTSAYIVQLFKTLDKTQIEHHRQAMHVLEQSVQKCIERIRLGNANEYEIQQLILEQFEKNGVETHFPPIVAVNENGANPHYFPTQKNARTIKEGDLVLIDLWGKRQVDKGIYADITQMVFYGKKPTEKMIEIFTIVKKAQTKALELIKERLDVNQPILGYEVDQAARNEIKKAGYGKYFIHRLGHNIDENDHGSGAHLDSLETKDDRPLVPNTIFSIEPGIYIPNEIGVRLECNAFIDEHQQLHVTGGLQGEIFTTA